MHAEQSFVKAWIVYQKWKIKSKFTHSRDVALATQMHHHSPFISFFILFFHILFIHVWSGRDQSYVVDTQMHCNWMRAFTSLLYICSCCITEKTKNLHISKNPFYFLWNRWSLKGFSQLEIEEKKNYFLNEHSCCVAFFIEHSMYSDDIFCLFCYCFLRTWQNFVWETN